MLLVIVFTLLVGVAVGALVAVFVMKQMHKNEEGPNTQSDPFPIQLLRKNSNFAGIIRHSSSDIIRRRRESHTESQRVKEQDSPPTEEKVKNASERPATRSRGASFVMDKPPTVARVRSRTISTSGRRRGASFVLASSDYSEDSDTDSLHTDDTMIDADELEADITEALESLKGFREKRSRSVKEVFAEVNEANKIPGLRDAQKVKVPLSLKELERKKYTGAEGNTEEVDEENKSREKEYEESGEERPQESQACETEEDRESEQEKEQEKRKDEREGRRVVPNEITCIDIDSENDTENDTDISVEQDQGLQEKSASVGRRRSAGSALARLQSHLKNPAKILSRKRSKSSKDGMEETEQDDWSDIRNSQEARKRSPVFPHLRASNSTSTLFVSSTVSRPNATELIKWYYLSLDLFYCVFRYGPLFLSLVHGLRVFLSRSFNSLIAILNTFLLFSVSIALRVCIEKGHEQQSPLFLDVFDERLHPILTPAEEANIVYDTPPSRRHLFRFIGTIYNKLRLHPECAVMMLVYIDRIVRYHNLTLHATNWRRVVLATLILATKVWEDAGVWNVDFKRALPAVTSADLRKLEVATLELIRYNVVLQASQYVKYYFKLREIAEAEDSVLPTELLEKEQALRMEARSVEEKMAIREMKLAIENKSQSLTLEKRAPHSPMILN